MERTEARTLESFDPASVEEMPVQNLKPYGVGIDTHKRFIQVCVLTRDELGGGGGQILRSEREFSTDWADLLAAKDWAVDTVRRRCELKSADALEYTIESTGTYHQPVLRAWGAVPSVVNPLLASPSRRKTDVLDARLLAQQAMVGLWPKSYIPSDDCVTLRVLLNERQDARREALRCRNRVENIMLRYGHTFHAQAGSDSPEVEGLIEMLLEVDHLDDSIVGKLKGVAPNALPEAARLVLRRSYYGGKLHQQRAKEFTKHALKFVEDAVWPGPRPLPGKELLELLQTVPGVGPVTALMWIAHVHSPARFVDAKQVAAFCGCDPTLKISAGKVTSHTRRGGNKELRRVLLQAAAVVLRKADSPLGAWGRSIAGRSKRGGWKKACGAVARRLSAGLWHVHRTASPFDASKWQLTTEIEVPEVSIREMLGERYARTLEALGFTGSRDVVKAFYDGLGKTKGVGEGCLAKIKAWVKEHGERRTRSNSTPPPASSSEET